LRSRIERASTGKETHAGVFELDGASAYTLEGDMNESWKQWEGQTVDEKFLLGEYLGGSNHSAVYATELTDGETQRAAIKLIEADPGCAETQMNRWRQAAELSHLHLIRIFRMGRCWLEGVDLLYVVTERGDEDLAEILPKRALTPEEAQAMLPPALDALAYLHSKSLVHGHIKPSNILAIDDQLKISSDGICGTGKLRVDELPLTIYDAPETAGRGQTPTGDIWSLGITLVEALTQRPPVWERNRPGELVVPATVPAPFFEIARRCLRRDPQVRWTIADVTARFAPVTREPEAAKAEHATAARMAQPEAQAVAQVEPESQPASSSPSETEKSQAPTFEEKHSPRWRYSIPAAVGVVAAIALFAGPKLVKQHADAQPTELAVAAEPAAQPAPDTAAIADAAPAPEVGAPRKEPSPALSAPAPAPSSPARLAPVANPTAAAMMPGEVTHRVEPDVSERASRTIRGTVRVAVKVRVDRSGRVTGEMLDERGPSHYFANIAVKTARQWAFSPAAANGRNVPSEWILRFEFRQNGSQVIPKRVTP
jgi:TonB family protein